MATTFQSIGQLTFCNNCACKLEHGSKFCGECGTVTELGSGAYDIPAAQENGAPGIPTGGSDIAADQPAMSIPQQVSYEDLARLEAYRLAQTQGADTTWAPTPSPVDGMGPQAVSGPAPMFAREGRSASRQRQIPPGLIREMQALNALLLRERMFLIGHWSIFVCSNILGLFLAMECYHGFVGDEVSKIVMALTPITFINLMALACLAPIKGTRREIARVKERIQFVRVQMEFSDIL